ncbi:MAG: rubredoxin reductase [Proteobacteria bacterium]|nr:rubredoxin reductase [Pseudomonadota bacterium]
MGVYLKTYQCIICGWIYDEAAGCPEEGIAPGTRWQDIPEDWCCPVCGAKKGDFSMVAIEEENDFPAATPSDQPALIIIGSGLAAYTLAREFRQLDSAAPLLLITRDGGGYFSKPTLSNALASQKTPAQLLTKTADQMAAELQAEIRPHTEVTAIDPAKQQIILTDGSHLDYGRLVIAWGADPIRLSFEGDGADAVQSVNDLDDYSHFHASLENARSVAVIGAGLIGCEFANDLASRQMKTSLIDPAAWPLSRQLPEAAGKYLSARLQAKGVEFCFGTSVKAIYKSAATYRLELADGHQIMADQILSAIGLRPRTAAAQAAGITCQRGIVTDRFLKTNLPGIYAMGDCAEIAGLILPFITPILHQAKALAKTLAGEPTALIYPAMPVAVKTPACPTMVCSPPAGAEGTWHCQTIDGGMEALYQSPTGELLGFALLGNATARSQSLAAQLPAVLA